MKVLVIDGDIHTCDVIQLTFELGWPEVKVILAESGEKGIGLVEAESPGAIILELDLPDTNGFEVLKEIRLFSETPLLMMSTSSEESNIVKALTWGANDYLQKPFRQMEFLARVKTMTRNIRVTDREMVVNSGSWHFGRSVTELYRGHDRIELTPVEGLLMHTLIKHSGEYLDSNMLIQKVWGESSVANADSLRVHVHHLRKKLGDDYSHPFLIINKPGRGYMFNNGSYIDIEASKSQRKVANLASTTVPIPA